MMSTAVEGTAAEAGQSGTASVHSVPKPAQATGSGPAWGGAGLPARIQVCVQHNCYSVNFEVSANTVVPANASISINDNDFSAVNYSRGLA